MPEATSGREQIQATMQEWDAAWAAKDADALAACFTQDGVYEDPTLPTPLRGRAELRDYLMSVLRAVPDIEVHQEHLFTDEQGTAGSTQWRIRGTMSGRLDPPGIAATGDHVDFTGMVRFTMRDGRVDWLRQYQDITTLQRQIGMMPPQGSRSEKALLQLHALSAKRRMKKNSK